MLPFESVQNAKMPTSYLKRKSKVPKDSITPPTARSRSSSISSIDSSSSYFSKTYIPLSSLPTPPLSSHSSTSTRQTTPEIVFAFTPGNPQYLGPAIHLANLIPSSCSLTTPSIPLVHSLLTRADLPLETVALAVAILDSLNCRFALTWRKQCPLTPGQHIDSLLPELIPFSALILATKFLDDAIQSTKWYAEEWGSDLWTYEQLNSTQRCLLENLGYRLLPLWEESIINEALEDMNRASSYSNFEDWEGDACFDSSQGENDMMSTGKAVMGAGEQLTPVETPILQNAHGIGTVSRETKDAFRRGSGTGTRPRLQLPDRSREPFPLFESPATGIEVGM